MEKPQSNPIRTQPRTLYDKALIDAFAEEIPQQIDRLEKLLLEMVKVQLAVPGIFLAILKMSTTENGLNSNSIRMAFILWAVSLALNLLGLLPKSSRNHVLPNVTRRTGEEKNSRKVKELTIEEYYMDIAKRKQRFLFFVVGFFFCGTVTAVISLF